MSVWPSIANPDMVGAGVESNGSPDNTVAVGSEVSVTETYPSRDPVIRTEIVFPTSETFSR